MNKLNKLKVCNWGLLLTGVVMLASGLQLEINPQSGAIWVWLHVLFGVAMVEFVIWHHILNRPLIEARKNMKSKNPAKAREMFKRQGGIWLSLFFILMAFTGVVALAHWYIERIHSIIGGIHGKLGFLFIIFCVIHTVRHFKFYLGRKD